MTPPATPEAPVASPCNQVCRIDAVTGWCEGCGRSLDEIVAWPTLSDDQKRAVWRLLPLRGHAGSPGHQAIR